MARMMRKSNRVRPTSDAPLLLLKDIGLLVRHGFGSRVDRVAVNAGDRGIVRSAQPSAADRRPPARGAALPQRTMRSADCVASATGRVRGRIEAYPHSMAPGPA